MIKEYDNNLYEHCCRTAELTKILGEMLGRDTMLLYTSAMVHDIGKIIIPQDIILKTGKLNSEERKLVDLHSFLGYSILKNLKVDERIYNIVLFHHGTDKERFNYVKNPTEDLIIDSSIVMVADAFDALTSDRSYSKARTKTEAFHILYEEQRFDKHIVDVLVNVCSNKRGKLKLA